LPISVKYSFRQHFNIPAREAYEWCTDYTPEDQALMQEKNAEREVQHVAENVRILTDTYVDENNRAVKEKLVCLYPDQLFWTSTHVAGPNKHSQFLYQIIPENKKRSCLRFVGLHLDYRIKEDISRKEIDGISRKLRKIDSETWKILAKEMEKELKH